MAPEARGKIGAPMFETKVFVKQMHCIEKSTCNIVGIFRRPSQSFCSPAVIWHPENCLTLVTPLRIAQILSFEIASFFDCVSDKM